MNLYVVRHGQTEWNVLKKMQGSADIPLNETGLEQAKQINSKLSDIDFNIIYCSPLIRAKQTANIINEKRSLNIVYDNRLRERNYGEFEGVSKSSFDYNEFWAYTLNKNYRKAENIQEFFKRVSNLLEELKTNYKDDSVLIVAHARIMKAIECLANEMMSDEEIGPYLPDNANIKKYII